MQDKGLQKWFRRDNFLILILAGILLVIIAIPTDGGTGQDADRSAGADKGGSAPSEAAGGGGEATVPEEGTDGQYAGYLEGRLTETLSQMADVGKVKVMITIKASRELVVEMEQPVSRSSVEEKDSQGGSRATATVDSRENAVYRTEGGVSEPYVVKTLAPRIEGVLVVAEGAGKGTVSRSIVEIVQALFGVEAHKVKVVKMEGTGGP